MPCYSPLDGYKNEITGGWQYHKGGSAQKLTVACGSCLGCRLDHAVMWATRIVHESSLYLDQQGNCFVTLTYREPHECTPEQYKAGHYVPADYSLRPSDVTNFIRRLRRSVDHEVRYFYCGEYGDETQRPHYHLCLFNKSFYDQTLFKDDEGFHTFTSPSLEKLWPYGFSTVQPLSYENAAYTARYSLKKITGKRAWDHYLRCDEHGVAYWLRPEFIRMSTGNRKGQNNGLGARFYEKYTSDIFPSDEVPVPGKGVIQKVPRYYENILKCEDPDTHQLVKDMRQVFIKHHREDFTPDRLRQKYHCQKARQRLRGL